MFKKILSASILAAIAATTMFIGISAAEEIETTISKDEYVATYATRAGDYHLYNAEEAAANPDLGSYAYVMKNKPLRFNPDNALGEPDGKATSSEGTFISLLMFDYVTYYFDEILDAVDEETGLDYAPRWLHNYRGEDEDVKPDLSLNEVTYGTSYYPEAVRVVLLDAMIYENDEYTFKDEYEIGIAFNNDGINSPALASFRELDQVNGFKISYELINGLGYTHIWFPDEVYSARGVKLEDVTMEFNQHPYPSNNRFLSERFETDGFDLDAMVGWYLKSAPFTPIITPEPEPQYDEKWTTETAWGGWVTSTAFPMKGSAIVNNVQRLGTAWGMAILFSGQELTVDLVYSQHTDAGDINLRLSDDGKWVEIRFEMEDLFRLEKVHFGGFKTLKDTPNAPGQITKKSGKAYEANGVYYVPYTGGTTYIAIHTETGKCTRTLVKQ